MKTNTATPLILHRFLEHMYAVCHTSYLATEQAFYRRFRLTETPSLPSPNGAVIVERELSKRAFSLWKQAGHPDAREWEYWTLAKNDIAAGNAVPTPTSKL